MKQDDTMQTDDLSASARALFERFLHSFFVLRDISAASCCLSRQLQWYGTADSIDFDSYTAIVNRLQQDIEVHPTAYTYFILTIHEQRLSPGVGNVSAKVKLQTRLGEAIYLFFVSTCMEDGVCKICSLHLSVPDGINSKKSFPPYTLAEKHAQELMSHYFQEALTWGVLSGYNSPGFPLFYVNSQMLHLLGYEELYDFVNDLHGLLENGMHPEDRAYVSREVASQLQQKGEYRITYRMMRKDGSYLWIDDYGKSVNSNDGREVIVSVCFDITERIKDQEQLDAAHQQAKLVLESKNRELNYVIDAIPGGVGLYKVGEHLEQVYASSGIASLLGYTPDELEHFSTLDFMEFIYHGDHSLVSQHIYGIIHDNLSDEIAFRMLRKQGDYVWVRALIHSAGTQDDAPLLHMVLTNITEETALYQDALDQTNEIIVICDYQTRELLYLNKAASDWCGHPHSAPIGQPCYQMLLGRSAPCPNCHMHHFTFDTLKSVELKLNGHYFAAKGKRIRWNGHDAFIEYISDVTAVHQESLKVLNDRAMLVAATRVMYPMCIAVNLTQNSYYMIEYDNFNAKKAAPNGVFDELIQAGLETIPDDDKKSFSDAFSRENLLSAYQNGARYVTLTHRQYGLDGTCHWNRTTAVFFKNNEDNNLYEITLTDCVDDQKQTEMDLLRQEKELKSALLEAQKANNAKGDFLARMSHDMRTPMNTILGLIAITLDELDDPQEIADNLSKMKSASDFMLGLINDILDRAKIDDGNVVLKQEPYSYRAFLDNMYTMFAPQCQKKGIHFHFKNMTAMCTVLTDKTRLNQIFFNLLSNAVKFTPPGGTITYRTENLYIAADRVSADYIVEDTGIGMSEEFQTRMFQPFTQEDPRVTPELQGSGLGLSIAKSLIELMGGTIDINSKQGKGTKITVHLTFALAPQQLEDLTASTIETADTSILQGKHVLLAEDHPVNAMIAKKLLEKQGMVVFHEANGQLALERFSCAAPDFFDLILMDIRMPVMNGLDAAKAIRSLNRTDAKTIPIIAMTANAYAEDREHSFEAGMNAHIAKPIEPEQLFSTLADEYKKAKGKGLS